MSLKLSFKHLVSQLPEELKKRIDELKDVPQRADHHPEGSVFNHTKIVVDRLIKYQDPILSWSAIYHDIGKFETTKINGNGIIQALGHENVSAELVMEYYPWLIQHVQINPEIVMQIVKHHMRIKHFEEMKTSKQMELASLPSFGRLWIFRQADDMSTLTKKELESIK